MSTKLQISDGLKLPLEFITQTQAILARKRVGKSYTASVQAEELLKARQQIVVIDVTGAWWGLRASADGKGAGFPILVAGGDHGDIPLEESAGEVMASAIVSERFSAILDLSAFRKGAALRFLAVFFETLYRKNRDPLHLFADEADYYCPQRPFGEDARTVGALDDIVRRGGIRGIGCTLISQRPAVLNANVRTQCGILTTLRISHPLDLKAIKDWIDVHADESEASGMMESLPTLPIGTAWMWAPGWPTEAGIFERIKIRCRETFDSGATPRPGERVAQPKVLAPVDVEKLGASIKATVEQAKSSDPVLLKKRIAELERAAAVAPKAAPATETIIEKPVVTDAQVKRVESIATRLEKEGERRIEAAEALRLSGEELRATAKEFTVALGRAAAPQPAARPMPQRASAPVSQPRASVERAAPATDAVGRDALSGPERRIIDALAWLESIGITEPEQPAVAFLAGYTTGGGAWNNPRGALRTKGMIDYLPGDRMRLTDAGRTLATFPTEALTNEKLHAMVMSRLPGPEQKILKPLLEVFPAAMTNDDLAASAGYSNGGGAYNNPRGRLRTLGLIEYRDGGVAARAVLFPETAAA